jgi:hypothetical protein
MCSRTTGQQEREALRVVSVTIIECVLLTLECVLLPEQEALRVVSVTIIAFRMCSPDFRMCSLTRARGACSGVSEDHRLWPRARALVHLAPHRRKRGMPSVTFECVLCYNRMCSLLQ